jgi:hypothetical protein
MRIDMNAANIVQPTAAPLTVLRCMAYYLASIIEWIPANNTRQRLDDWSTAAGGGCRRSLSGKR